MGEEKIVDVVLVVDNDLDLKFRGHFLAMVKTPCSIINSKSLVVYKTVGGNYVVYRERITFVGYQRYEENRSASVYESLLDLVNGLGYDSLSKELYRKLSINCTQTVE